MPRTSTSPLVRESSPVKMLIVVVFPDPLGPSNPNICPCFSVTLTSIRASFSFNIFLHPSTRLLSSNLLSSLFESKLNIQYFRHKCSKVEVRCTHRKLKCTYSKLNIASISFIFDRDKGMVDSF